MQKITLKVPDMYYSACVMRLEGIEDDLQGVTSAEASYKKQTLKVSYDERLLKVEEILKAVRSLGYSPTLASANQT